jgi:hypothetical protein
MPYIVEFEVNLSKFKMWDWCSCIYLILESLFYRLYFYVFCFFFAFFAAAILRFLVEVVTAVIAHAARKQIVISDTNSEAAPNVAPVLRMECVCKSLASTPCFRKQAITSGSFMNVE